MKRRLILQSLATTGGLAGLGLLPRPALASDNLKAHKLTERLTLITGAGGNVVLFQGLHGLTLVDSGAEDQTAALLTLVDELTGAAPIQLLFNTHWSDDFTGGNEAIRARGARIVAHENTRLWLGADFDVYWRNWSHKPRPVKALPDTTFYSGGSRDVDGETVQYGCPAQAYTDGDTYVYFPDSNVMVAGGLLSGHGYPVPDIATGGWIGGLIQANADMLAMTNANTIIVPDRGPATNRTRLQAQHDMLSDLYEKMKALEQQGFNGHDMLMQGLTADYDPLWGDPEQFVLETYRGMWAHTYDMGGFI